VHFCAKKTRVELSQRSHFHNHVHPYLANRMPTIARGSKGANDTVTFKFCRTPSPDEKSMMNRGSRSTRLPLVFSLGEHRLAASAYTRL
jgi:hypothetical protein